jgi:hypothetical protein
MIKTEQQYKIEYVDASSLSTFSRCPAKYLFERLLGLEEPNRSSIAADFGTDMHKAIPFCYEGTPEGIERACVAFNEGWLKRGYEGKDDARNSAMARRSLIAFAASHSPSHCPYTILPFPIKEATADKVSDNEVPFAVDIGGPLPALGRIDAPVLWNSTKKKWALDYKTSSEVSARLFGNFEMAPQTCLYTLALSSITNEPIEGMIIEAIRVSPKNAENQLAFMFVSEQLMTLFLENAIVKSELILKCNEAKAWPQNTCACSGYSMFEGTPTKLCKYHNICKDKDWMNQVRYYEQHEPFHPFKVK